MLPVSGFARWRLRQQQGYGSRSEGAVGQVRKGGYRSGIFA